MPSPETRLDRRTQKIGFVQSVWICRFILDVRIRNRIERKSVAELLSIISIGFVLDMFLGDPNYRYHPIRLIGHVIAFNEKALRKIGWDGRPGGFVLSAFTALTVLFFTFAARRILTALHPWLSFLFDLYLAYSCLAFGDLLNHIKPVIGSLETGDLNLTKQEISKVVGRDVESLDESGLARAALETMAENFVDGFLSPLFWYFIGGICAMVTGVSAVGLALGAMLLFKVASTLDSMVGYKSSAYMKFGWAGARFDDVMNFLPARISIFILFFGAWVAGLKPFNGLKTALKDRLKHDSPNAGHAESFLAGALDVRLGGPTKYAEGLKKKPWLGDGTPDAGVNHIYRAISLLRASAWIALVTLLALFFYIYYVKAS
jgi:adenosylcobinamide-phosphate synthase